jgi:secreted Zn-dependent insulinase-like peptidase
LLTKLFTRLINKNLEEKFDQALSAGYFFRFRALQSDGIVSLYLSGYNTNLHNLFNDLVMNILEMKLEKKELTRGILNMKNEIDNLVNDTPLGLVYTNLLEKTSRFFYSIKDLKKASRSIKPEDFLVWKKIFNLDMKVVILHGGNDIPLKGISFEKYLPSQALKIIDPFVFKPVNIEIQHPNKNESNTGIGYFYHVKMAGKAVATCALVELFTLLFSESFFNVMRTKNQFGYITRMSYYRYKYNFIVTQEIQTPLEDIEIIIL